MKKVLWAQVGATVILICSLVFLHFRLSAVGMLDGSVLLLLGFFIGVITYCYVMVGLAFAGRKDLLEHPIWRKMPLLTLGLAVVSFILFVFLFMYFYNNDLGNPFVFLLGIVYFVIVYFLFILAMVYFFSEQKEKVVHRTYFIAILLVVLAFFVV